MISTCTRLEASSKRRTDLARGARDVLHGLLANRPSSSPRTGPATLSWDAPVAVRPCSGGFQPAWPLSGKDRPGMRERLCQARERPRETAVQRSVCYSVLRSTKEGCGLRKARCQESLGLGLEPRLALSGHGTVAWGMVGLLPMSIGVVQGKGASRATAAPQNGHLFGSGSCRISLSDSDSTRQEYDSPSRRNGLRVLAGPLSPWCRAQLDLNLTTD
ncbi:hypothetical protein BKA56DRAFT_327137 [Ilyonectria sp. MPI-CAGE-AT-0026]|nr:hypothetical protein BKA56DRAFT_327137 [Ilyonectria sp. MPI-CAGE-AT-0026]